MIRKQTLAALAAVAGLMVPSSAMALGIVIDSVSNTNADPSFLGPGDVLTVNLIVENPTLVPLFGAGIAARGYDLNGDGVDNDGLGVVGGQVSSAILQPITGIAGVPNVLSAPDLRGAPQFLNPGNPSFQPAVPLHAQLFDGVSVQGFPFDGAADEGVGPNADIASGNVHFQIQFTPNSNGGLVSPTAFTLQFGIFADLGAVAVGAGGTAEPFTNASLPVTVVPEPGTALLMGLGLAGLATTRRR